MKSRPRFYFEQQGGRCYLRQTPHCIAVGGAMNLLTKEQRRSRNGVHRKDDASWDHIFPKPRSCAEEPFQLLACYACNNARGNAPAKAEHIALGMRMLDEYRAQQPLPGTGKRARRRAEKARRAELLGQHVPNTVEEALAQGGVVARQRTSISIRADREAESMGQNLPRSRATKEACAAELGVTDDRFRPGAKSRTEKNAEVQVAALKGIAERAKKNGDKQGFNNLTQKARSILATLRGEPEPSR